MLKRAASNAYSWWRASHIRTKQSKWLDNNLDEMEDTVKKMLKLIEPDADSFAKRAELYFKMRPELISFVEDVYKAYRALAERYDHISGELHKANHTIATCFPEQVQYAMLEDDDNLPKAITPINPRKINKGTVEGLMNKKKEADFPKKKGKNKKSTKAPMDKEQAREEINKLQKSMLILQTEKEFVKSSYESGIAKYWEIEKQFMEMHERVHSLEEEFNTSAAVEDNDARVLMAETVLKSCEDIVSKLQEQRNKALDQEKEETDRTKVVKEKLEALKGGPCPIEIGTFDGDTEMSTSENMEEFYTLNKTTTELQSIHEKIKVHFEEDPESSVIDLAEKIEELANKVITMEISDSTRAMQINKLNLQNNELEKYILSLEEDKVTLSNDPEELDKRLKEVVDELNKVQAIKKIIQDEEKNFRENFNDTWECLNGITQRMQPPTSPTNACIQEASQEEEILASDTDLQRESVDKEVTEIHDIKEISSEKDDQEKTITSVEKESSEADLIHPNSDEETVLDEQEATVKLQQFLSGLEGKEKILVAGFTSILQNYNETKTKLSEVEKKYDDYLEETRDMIEELEELKNDIAMKDEEIRLLRRPMRQLIRSLRRGSMDTAEGPPVRAPPVEVVPIEAPPIEVFPVEAPPVEIPPIEAPVVEAPPTEVPLDEAPPGEVTSVEAPPAEVPSVEIPPVEAPPLEIPPVEAPPLEIPPDEAPPVEAPLAEDSPAEALPVEIPPVEATPDDAPPVEVPPVESPPAEAPPVEVPAVEAPPIEASPVEVLPVESPAIEDPPAEAPAVEDPPAEDPAVEVPPAEDPSVDAPGDSRLGRKKLERKSNSAMETWSTQDSERLRNPDIKSAAAAAKAMRKPLTERVPKRITPFEAKFRMEIDGLLDDKLEFWLKFSTAFCQIQEFKAKYEDLENDIKAKDNKSQEYTDSVASDQAGKSESAELSTGLRELKTEMHVWLEQGALLKQDLQDRYSSLCEMQEEILNFLNEDIESGDSLISPYQAERFQGEVINMKLENKKISSELRVGVDQVKGLHDAIEARLNDLHQNFGPFPSKSLTTDYFDNPSKANVPLRDFLFGVKPKKTSILSKIQHGKHKAGRRKAES